MLLFSRFKSIHRPFCCLAVGLLGFSTALSAQYAVGQQFRVPQVQQPTRIYQSPIIRGPIYQSPNYFPGQTPIVGQPGVPVYRAPQGTIQTPIVGQPITGRPPQTVQPSQRQITQAAKLAAEQASLDAEKIAVLEKLNAKYKALAEQGTPAELEALMRKNSELVKELESQRRLTEKNAVMQNDKMADLTSRFEQLTTDYDNSETKVGSLEKKLAATGLQNPVGMKNAEKLAAQVVSLKSEIETLSREGKSYADQLADSKAALKAAMESQSDQSEKVDLVQRSQELVAENLELTQGQGALKQGITELEGRLSESQEKCASLNSQLGQAQSSNQQLMNQIAKSGVSDESGVMQIAAVGGSGVSPVQATSFTQPAVDVSSFESKIAQLTRKNRQLADSNADFKSEIKSLDHELTSLKKQGSEVAAGQAAEPLVSNAVPAAADVVVSPKAVDGKGGWGTLGWLLPFLAIGFGIAFFVIMKEEFQRSPAGADRNDRKN